MASLCLDRSLQSMPASRESLEGLQKQLLCTFLELEYMRKASKAQSKLNDAKLQHLQEMLDAAQKERDKAFQECQELQERLFNLLTDPQQFNNVVQSACPTHSSRGDTCVYSPSSDSGLEKSLDTIPEAQFSHFMPTLSKAQPTLPSDACEGSFTINTPEQYDLTFLTENKALPLQENVSFSDSQEQFSMEIFSENAAFNPLASLDLTELKVEENLITNWEVDLRESWEASLSSPSSETSTAASQLQSRKNNEALACPTIQASAVLSTKVSVDMEKGLFSADILTRASQQPIVATPSSPSSNMIATASDALNTRVPNKSSAMATPLAKKFTHHPTALPPQASPKIKRAKQMRTSMLAQKRQHLPEPPEAKMEVMLSSLPEKGRLLEAVIQAGPLLQHLLLAGPLPQWKHPPPQLITTDIPRVLPTSPSSVLPPFSHVQSSSSIHPSQLPYACQGKRFAPCNFPSRSCVYTPSCSSSKRRKLEALWV